MVEFGLLLRWLVVYGLVAGLALPVAARLFPRLDGRGAGLALPVGLVLVAWGAYWVGQLRYGAVAALAGLALLAAASAACALDRAALREGDATLALDVGPDGDVDPRALRQAALVFLAGFALVVWIRALDPAVAPLGGEKFLDFGLLKALERADALPPEDMWFAGEPVAYYYGGHLIASVLGHLTATPPRYAYNLALAGYYGALLAAVYDLAAAVGAARGADRRLSGAAAAFLVGGAANFAPAGRVLLQVLPRPVAGAVADASNRTTAEILADTADFFYFDASRVIPGTINEFPLFAWLNGDLHAHMMSTPFLVLAAALGYAYYRTPAAERRRRRALAFGAVPTVGALVAIVDTWSFPTVFGLLWLAVAMAPAPPRSLFPDVSPLDRLPDAGPSGELVRPLVALAVAGLAALPALVLAAPFLAGAATGGSRSVALLAPAERSALGPLLLVHGPFLAAAWPYLLSRTEGRRLLLALGVVAAGVVGLAVDLAVLPVAGPLLVVGWLAGRVEDDAGYETVLLVAGAGLVAIVEVVYLAERAGPLRMNTVFKTYAQVWVLWGVGGGVALATYVADASPSVEWRVPGVSQRGVRVAFAVLLVASTGVYAAQALPAHAVAGRDDPTLDATAFVAEHHPGEAPAIRALDDVEGTPTMLSAPATSRYPGPGGSYPSPPGMYGWNSSPAASLTGVPTVAGWHHEVGYRGPEPYLARVRDVDDIYTSTGERRRELLRTYEVRYVWVGPAERARYGRETFGFDRMDRAAVLVRTPTVTVYRIESR
jgi:YYY domain-containing protein